MPLNEGVGCLAVLLKFLVELIGGLAEGLLESAFVDFLGWIGAWTERIVTLGRSKPDPESWFCIAIGFVVVILTVTLMVWWAFKG
ncbi:hypothetical protein [Prosthecobacter sp.]|uniref:hypothetical protein n=1 Tax=Prosthecobacter sp. TaxID=1965333 RepID=UPI002AB8F833|nr:hypothetical protein [Prosthecobacter sp.]MDZ4404067.1 hypothetical protein [Prosthecobacter sp.]